jgi:hypothetical protein
MRYEISSRHMGDIFGVYEAETPEKALEAMVSEANGGRTTECDPGMNDVDIRQLEQIEMWIDKNNYQMIETRQKEHCYNGPDNSFLVLNPGDSEQPFWNLYYPPGDGERADETGSWNEIPKHNPSVRGT